MPRLTIEWEDSSLSGWMTPEVRATAARRAEVAMTRYLATVTACTCEGRVLGRHDDLCSIHEIVPAVALPTCHDEFVAFSRLTDSTHTYPCNHVWAHGSGEGWPDDCPVCIASTTDGSAVLQEEPPGPSVEAHPQPRKEQR